MGDPRRESEAPGARSAGGRLSGLILRLAGWRIAPFPAVDRAVVAGGPHTSNWDAIVGLLGGASLALHPTILIKQSAFRWPLGVILRRMGGMPIDRTRHAGVVEQAVEQFTVRERLIMVVTPEGTRTNAPRWKTGFYHIARLARVPIIVAVADYAEKTITFPLIVEPGGDMEADMQRMVECFAAVTPRHPAKLSLPVKFAREEKLGLGG